MSIEDDLVKKLDDGADVVTEKSDIEKEAEKAVGGSPEDQKLNIAEAKIEPDRPELICKEDILKILEMDKDQLQKYSTSRLNKKIDLSRRVKQLRLEVATSVKNKLNIPTDTVGKPDGLMEEVVKLRKTPEFIFNPLNRRVFEWSAMLARRDDLIEVWLVDENGKRI